MFLDLAQAMLVDDVAGSIVVPGFRMVGMEQHENMRGIAQDIHGGKL